MTSIPCCERATDSHLSHWKRSLGECCLQTSWVLSKLLGKRMESLARTSYCQCRCKNRNSYQSSPKLFVFFCLKAFLFKGLRHSHSLPTRSPRNPTVLHKTAVNGYHQNALHKQCIAVTTWCMFVIQPWLMNVNERARAFVKFISFSKGRTPTSFVAPITMH